MNGLVNSLLNLFKRNHDLSSTQLATVKYGLEYSLSFLMSFTLTVILSLVLRNTKIVLFIILGNASFRFFSGGYHLKSMLHCSLFGAITLNLLGILVKTFESSHLGFYIYVIPTLVFMPLYIHCFVPVDISNTPIKQHKISKSKSASMGIFIIWLVMLLPWKLNFISSDIIFAISAGFLWQIFMLTPFSKQMIISIERRLG